MLNRKNNLLFFIILSIIVIFGFSKTTNSHQKKDYQNYTIVFNVESNEGFVYKNAGNNNCLITVYPSLNKTYIYEKKEFLTGAQKLKSFYENIKINLDYTIVSFIEPVVKVENQ